MDKVNKIHKDIKIESADLLLKNAAKEINSSKDGTGTSDLNSVEVMEALRHLRKTTIT
jgi:hypothetical protein